jgi:hypothetical protein
MAHNDVRYDGHGNTLCVAALPGRAMLPTVNLAQTPMYLRVKEGCGCMSRFIVMEMKTKRAFRIAMACHDDL